jgi:hypothetical protein
MSPLLGLQLFHMPWFAKRTVERKMGAFMQKYVQRLRVKGFGPDKIRFEVSPTS